MPSFDQLQKDVLGVFHVWRTNEDGKRVVGPSLLEYHERFEREDAEKEQKRKNRPASFVLDDNHNPVMVNGSRVIDAERTEPERAERLAKLQAAYATGEEISPFGEYDYTEDFFGHQTEEVLSEPVVEIEEEIDFVPFLEAIFK